MTPAHQHTDRVDTVGRRGFTLLEMVIGLAIFGVLMTAAYAFFSSQSKNFRDMSEQSSLVQSMRFGRDLLRQELRTAGTNVAEDQPMIVYASDSVFAFNADLTTNVEDSVKLTGAVYVDRFAPAAAVSAMRLSAATAIAGSAPAFTYPLADYSQTPAVFVNSDAETITFWFERDTTTAVVDDYVLYRRTNTLAPDVVMRGARRNGSLPFFRYWYDPARLGGGAAPLDTVPTAWMPLSKNVPQRGTSPDTGTAPSIRIDLLRAVEVNYEVSSQRKNNAPRTKLINYMVPMPNVARPRTSRACGRPPFFGRTVAAAWRNSPAPAGIELTFAAAIDQGGGEDDVIRYIVWRRIVGSTSWGDPHVTIGTSGTSYTYRDPAVLSGTRYEYAVAAQDCTPNISSTSISNGVLVP
jgi:prepilin-type N-terminal cleavage/methylation domain-containing protein